MIPGFERFNERIARDIFYLPNAARDSGSSYGRRQGEVHRARDSTERVPAGRYIMMTIRSHDQFNTHLYGLDDRYRGIFNGGGLSL